VIQCVGRFGVLVIGGRIAVHLRVEQVRAPPRQRIARQQVHHRQRGHAGADADGDRQHHQHGEQAVALEAVDGKVEVIAEHSFTPFHFFPLPRERRACLPPSLAKGDRGGWLFLPNSTSPRRYTATPFVPKGGWIQL